MNLNRRLALISANTILSLSLLGCAINSEQPQISSSDAKQKTEQQTKKALPHKNMTPFYGTLNPYAAESIYFLLTDRFVDGDKSNNQEKQGGKYPSFDLPLKGPDGLEANVGYMGGDFKGVLKNAEYIKNMGFTSLWLTPIYDNPDQAFSGGEALSYGAYYKDGGKTGYHGYWGVNFYEVD